mmetsp:Transcript_53511/g.113648  ORF Transcript_53511/g.113648 Transcript_53511/m.113648 type:complete len:158 (-) Transcript_53511:314-787(-)
MSTPPTPTPNKTPLSSTTGHPWQNSCQVTRAVQTMSSLNQHHANVANTCRKYFYSRTHFPKILGAIMIASGITGYVSMGWWHGRILEERKRIYVEAYHNGQKRRESNGKNTYNGNDDNRLVTLARKMTRRVMDSSRNVTLQDAMNSSRLQRQVTKFW